MTSKLVFYLQLFTTFRLKVTALAVTESDLNVMIFPEQLLYPCDAQNDLRLALTSSWTIVDQDHGACRKTI